MTSTDSLKSLHTQLIDAREGYETAREEAESADMKDFFSRMVRLHAGLHTDIHDILTARGVQPEDDGSFMAAVHKTIISIRSAVTGLDASSLSGFADGEERIVKAYDTALADNAGDRDAASVLERHRAKLVAVVAEMKAAGT
jgi:uncharacterized protein (TIGR02284 family)